MLTNPQLKAARDSLLTTASLSAISADTAAGMWADIARAAETIADTSTTTSETLQGTMQRAAVAIEGITGTDGAAENPNYEGLLSRIVDALEDGEVGEGSLANRFVLAAEGFTGGGGPTVITPPSIAGTLTNGSTITWTPAVWSTGTATGQWHRDGVPISGQTGLTYTYVAATDDGTYLTVVETNGASTATSNALIAGENATFYETSFVGTNGTEINGWDGWSMPTTPRYSIVGNDLNQIQATAVAMIHNAPANDHLATMKLNITVAGGSDTGSVRTLFLRYTDANNYVALLVQNAGYSLTKRIGGTFTTLQSLTSFGRNTVTGDEITGEIRGDYVRVFLNGTQAPLSASANGGLGYHATSVPASSKVAFAGPQTAGTATFPLIVLTDFSIGSLPANAIAITSITEEDEATGNLKRLRIQANLTGTITQVQYLILDENGYVVVDWTDIAGISGAIFDGETELFDPFMFDGNATVWVRDEVIPDTTATYIFVPIRPAVETMVMGINENSLGHYDVGASVSWINNGDYNAQIARRGVVPISTGIAASSDGSGGTVERGWNGSIGGNSLGITTYGMVYNITNLSASDTGNWTIRFPVGTTVTHNVGATNWSYNSVTGIGTFDWPSPGAVTLDLRVNVATLTAAGLALISLKKTSVGSAQINPLTAANVAQLATSIRFLDVAAGNNDDIYPDRTQLAHPSRTPTQREQREGFRREDVVAHCNAVGASFYHNVRLFDSDALIEDDADYYLQNLDSGPINVSLSNELWNWIFKQALDVREAGVRAGFAPIGVTDPSLAVPETVYSATYPVATVTGSGSTRNTTVPYLDGEKFIYNGFNGVQVYQAIGNQSAGAGFQATTNANFSVLYNNTDTARAADRWVATRIARIREIWDARAAANGRTRPLYWIEGQAAGGFSSVSKYLDYNDFHLVVDGISAAHYWGGGVAGPNVGNYTNSVTGFTPSDKELLYTTSNQTTAINTLKDKFFAIAEATLIDPVGLDVRQWKQDIADYAVSKGLPKNHYKFGQYEMNHHLVFSNWPDEASAWSAATAYAVGNFAKDGGKISKCLVAHTNQVTSNATYWAEIADATVTAENRRNLFYVSLLDDSRFGDIMTHYYEMMQRYGGGLQHYYTRINFQGANGSWGVMSNEDDTANARFTALADFQANP